MMSVNWYQCPECKTKHLGRRIFGPQPDHLCEDCYRANDREEFISSRGVRCPRCGRVDRDDLGEMGIYDEGNHTVLCDSCDHEYEVETELSITWTSPALAHHEG